MILLADIGNTRIKWLLWEQGQVRRRGERQHRDVDPRQLGPQLWGQLERPAQVWIANVAGPELAAALSAWIAGAWSLEARFVHTEAAGFGVRCAYAVPSRLGVDRWVAMIGARALTRQACCVVDCGTAITIDALSSAGEHLGGVIFPGARLMREALYRDTRQIPVEAGTVTLFGRDTMDGVWGGTAYAVAAAIDRITRQMAAEMGESTCRLLTGGDAEVLRPYLEGDYRLEPDLIFQGLLVMAGERPGG